MVRRSAAAPGRRRSAAAVVLALAAIAAGLISAPPGDAAPARPIDVVLVTYDCADNFLWSPDPGPGAEPWQRGLLARADALNRRYELGRYAEGEECADLPHWLTALMLRSDALNRAEGLGAYSPGGR